MPGSLTNLYNIVTEMQIYTWKQMVNQLAVQGDRHQEITAVAEIKHLVPVAQFLKWHEFLYVMDTVSWKKEKWD